MATLNSYVERMSPIYFKRYTAVNWIGWANALLERLSGAGTLPPRLITRGAVVYDNVWIDRPPMSRDIREVRSLDQRTTYRFVEENNKLRLLDIAFPEAANTIQVEGRLRVDREQTNIAISAYGLQYNPALDVAEDHFKGWLYVITGGSMQGHTYIVNRNSSIQSIFNTGVRGIFVDFQNVDDALINTALMGDITGSYLIPPDGYLILYYTEKFRPVASVDDDLGIDGYENLVDAWFRWKIEEQVSSISQECAYWNAAFERELSRPRADLLNRINTPRGRTLAGFAGNRRYA